MAQAADTVALLDALEAAEARIRELEEAGAAACEASTSGDDAPLDAHSKWIELNRETLRGHANSFIALDPSVGIVASSPCGVAFEAQLGALSTEQRGRVVLFHASMYV